MFKLIPESQFGEHQLQQHGVWARFSEPDEIEEIVSWGVDRSEITMALAMIHDGSDHAMYPVLQIDPLPDYLDLYIRAEFETPDHQRLTGCLYGAEAFVATVYYAEDHFTFSAVALPDLNRKALARLRSAIGDSAAAIFPMEYVTVFRNSDGTPLCGSFAPRLI